MFQNLFLEDRLLTSPLVENLLKAKERITAHGFLLHGL
ncbi:hypothetical protein POREN0001_1661 [Porphyromonas endodontalis ATCC 35406]|uniref:Uncharacterized protein n=1 Tax=Porphyromonas endodontalis (strain ATCC 35406 / DSM 24491 / JCM 8526 / CCUG 16442 / BCRC 14492 / NCTC 13058 / HG 370) TaxID=553175 RepID=C3JBC8_POREA|nr:hypothetical protein POREN0001_1661 [Porphyromonas endodontalis ATCC 35406]